MQERYREYRQFIQSLDQYRKELGIAEEPNACLVVIPGTENSIRPIGSLLPIYPNAELGIKEGQFEKVLFNLKSLIGFDAYFPPLP